MEEEMHLIIGMLLVKFILFLSLFRMYQNTEKGGEILRL